MGLPIILGVDPGLDGAIAALDVETMALQIFRMPVDKGAKGRRTIDGAALATLVDTLSTQTERAFVEKVNGLPGQAGQFSFGKYTGLLLGVLYANRIPVSEVPAILWKPGLGLRKAPGMTKAQSKVDSRILAAGLFPSQAHEFDRVGDDGAAEAALIAYYSCKALLPEMLQ